MVKTSDPEYWKKQILADNGIDQKNLVLLLKSIQGIFYKIFIMYGFSGWDRFNDSIITFYISLSGKDHKFGQLFNVENLPKYCISAYTLFLKSMIRNNNRKMEGFRRYVSNHIPSDYFDPLFLNDIDKEELVDLIVGFNSTLDPDQKIAFNTRLLSIMGCKDDIYKEFKGQTTGPSGCFRHGFSSVFFVLLIKKKKWHWINFTRTGETIS